jgi:acyl-[acyl carrier protein]--UDP-N-acetylglucosamine O-acyltransferase
MAKNSKDEMKISVKNQYTIIATIAEVKDGGNVLLNGAGKYAYIKDEKTKWLVLEGNSPESSKFMNEKTEFVVGSKNEIEKTIFATAMINKKALKLTVEGDSPFTIISIKNP